MIDPMSVPYMQQAFGGGQLNERDMKNMMLSGMLGGGAGGMMAGRGMGLGSAQPAQIAQGPAPIQHNGPQQGPTLLGSAMSSGMMGGGSPAGGADAAGGASALASMGK